MADGDIRVDVGALLRDLGRMEAELTGLRRDLGTLLVQLRREITESEQRSVDQLAANRERVAADMEELKRIERQASENIADIRGSIAALRETVDAMAVRKIDWAKWIQFILILIGLIAAVASNNWSAIASLGPRLLGG